MGPIDLIYILLVAFIRAVKWIELQCLKPFKGFIVRRCVTAAEKIGVIFHFTDESYSNWSTVDEEKALTKCEKYDTLVHLRVYDSMYFLHGINWGSYASGEAYINKMWDFCRDEEDIAQFARRVLESNIHAMYFNWWNRLWYKLEFETFNLQTRSRATEVITKHYDLGNDIYEATLDPYMQYTCGYWAKADNLNDAQLDKLELIAKKLDLKPGMRVLDIGCGWGMLCKYLAERHGVHCVGVTISKEGADYSRKACKGLNVEIRMQDYRDIKEKFDRIVVVGMIEHVGFKNYREFFTTAHRNLKEDGIFLLHTIGFNHHTMPRLERWFHTYIFPNGCVPQTHDITKATKDLFIVEDWHNFGPDYAKTLIAWRDNFKKNWSSLKGNYGERFYRIWIYYLSMSEGIFQARRAQLWQIVFTKDGIKREYRAAR